MRYYTTWVETSESNAISATGGGSGGLLSAGAESSSDGEGFDKLPSSRSRRLRIPGFRSASSSASKAPDSVEGDDEGGEEDEDDEDEVSRNSASTVSERHLPTNGGGFSLSEFDEFDDFHFHRPHHHHRLRLADDDDSVATTTTTEMSGSRGSFPSIHFDKSTAGGDSSTEEEETDEGISSGSGSPQSDGIQFGAVRKGRDVTPAHATATAVGQSGIGQRRPRAGTVVGQGHRNGGVGKTIHPATLGTAGTGVPNVTRTLYIQMEFVERQTLREVSFIRCLFLLVKVLIGFFPFFSIRGLMTVLQKMRRGGCLDRSLMLWYICRVWVYCIAISS